MSKQLPWLRLYTEAIDDEKLRLLAFEDRWHFIALLCCKGQGILDKDDPLMRRKIAVKLGLDMQALDEVARRLSEVGLIDRETLEPLKWDDRQFKSDSSKERVARHRARQKQKGQENQPDHDGNDAGNDTETDNERYGNVTVTGQDTDKETDKDKTPPTPPGGESPASNEKPSRATAVTLKTFVENCKAEGEKPISGYKPLLDYVDATGLPMEFVQLAWEVFKGEFLPGGSKAARKQKNWRQHFMNYVSKGYYRLWYAKQGATPEAIEYHLTTQGHQAKAAISSEQAA